MVEELQRADGQQLMGASVRTIARLATSAFIVLASAATVRAETPQAYAPGHVPEPQGLHEGAMHGYTPNTITGGTVLDTAKLEKLIAEAHPLLLDVAEKDRKPPGMGPGMIWAPTHRSLPDAVFMQGGGRGENEKGYPDAFKARIEALTKGDKAKPIVTFCHPDCWGSYNAAKRLIGLGYTHVYWYREGTEGWQTDHDTHSVKPDAPWVSLLPKDMTQ